ncbi:flavin-containing monooxygenase [Amycolatopsis pithecellobii]|uniref:SidA/IucD/PvdA family monooxygenase n=1 Tax=Amycolatopsis pithecellobii TaxID=664692 RepID=A0A6N7YVY5_9PSEU|nr:NAD(P)/FAD-dependent oxidoreductase [Amycolatopsis pithecellobii]MTD53033.1 SidA/IucD/PvdA family monooxygenase [Amycolatopsis pithecellobii]
MMVAKQPELLAATDQTIDDALGYADPLVLRGLVYQLTADPELLPIEVETENFGISESVTVRHQADVAMIRAKAAAYLRACRDAGAGDVPLGPAERLPRSLALTAGREIPPPELDMWLEQLAVDRFARGVSWQEKPSAERLDAFSVVVIGAGMGGLNAGAQLAHAGITFTILEKNPEVGGTWYENRYPGCRVDTPSRTYTHVLGADFDYPSPFCVQSENERYVNWIADHFDLREKVQFGTDVQSLVWDEDTKTWEITALQGGVQRVWRANAVITAVGFLSRPNIPSVPGLDEFTGELFHTARWPSGLDLTGKSVAVVGSGCTGYQLVPELAKQTGHVYHFQRTPNWVFDVPGYLAPYPPQVNWLDRNFPYLVNFIRFQQSWSRRPDATRAANEIDPAFEDPTALSAANKVVLEQRLAFMRSKFADRPDLMAKMLPVAAPLSARPVLVDRDYSIYDALLDEDKVTLVTGGMQKVTAKGITAEDGTEYEVDAIALATGYRANDYLWPMRVQGRDGATPQELWAKDGARAYLGCLLPGFPNLFVLYGPNTNANVGFAAIHLEELVTRFAVSCIAGVIAEEKDTVDVTMDAYWRYNDELDRNMVSKVYLDPRANSYFTNEFRRSATNGAIDPRILWRWLRDPRSTDPSLTRDGDAISPRFGEDLVVE